jgi:hypothetical protein
MRHKRLIGAVLVAVSLATALAYAQQDTPSRRDGGGRVRRQASAALAERLTRQGAILAMDSEEDEPVPGTYVPQDQYGTWTSFARLAVSPQSGGYQVSATDLILPGKVGYPFRLARRYDPQIAQQDQSSANEWENWNVGDASYSMGWGWRLAFPFMRIHQSDDSSMEWAQRDALRQVVLPSGATYSLAQMAYKAGSTSPRVYENFHTVYCRLLWYQNASTNPYRLVMSDGEYYVFDSAGKLKEIHGWADGHRADKLTVSYSSGHITQVTGPMGWVASFDYSSNKIISVNVISAGHEDLRATYTRTGVGSGNSGRWIPEILTG